MDKLKTKILLISLLLILLFSVHSAAAATDSDGNLTSESIDLSICDNEGYISPDDVLSVSNDLDKLGADEATFSILAREISRGGNVELQHDYYICSDSDDTIHINGYDRIIDGKGAVIDMAGSTIRAFYVEDSGVTIKNLTIKNANFNGDGGAIYFDNSGTVENCNFVNNTATEYGGAVFFNSQGNVANCNFVNNTATQNGGAVFFYSQGNVANCNFADNTAGYTGGAVFFGDNNCEVTNCNFADNTAGYTGGAIYMISGNSVENCNFTNNSGGVYSGAIYMLSGSVENCNFTNNSAKYGGAIHTEWGSIENCNFTGNNATRGSAIFFWDTSATKTVSNSIFLNNRANAETFEVTKNYNNITITFTGKDNLLNAIYSRDDSEVTFTNVTYWSANGIANTGSSTPARSNREAGQNITLEIFDSDDKLVENVTLVTDINGQVVYDLAKLSNGKYRYDVYHLYDSYYTYAESNGTFTNALVDFNLLQREINEAAANSVLTLYQNYTFIVGVDENLADGIVIDKPITINGNGYTINALNKARIFHVTVENVVLNNITFTNANASGEGGAVFFDDNGVVTNCNFIDNSAQRGGAFYLIGNVIVTNCNFVNNSASVDSSAINIGFGTVTNCNFVNNSAFGDFGAIWIFSGNVTNCNFVNNSARYGGAVYFRDYGTVTNCNFTNNTATQDGGAVYFNGFYHRGSTVTNCSFISNNAKSNGGAIRMLSGSVANCNFTNNTATQDGGAVYFEGHFRLSSTVTNCNFTGNNATTGSAIYFGNNLETKTVSNSIFLNNRANAEALEVTKNENNITITFTGNNNLLNAIHSRNNGEVTFTNVTYWSANGINSTGNFPIKPPRSNRQAGQNITLEIFDSDDKLVENVTLVTDINGQAIYDLAKLSTGKFRYNVYHFEDSYYTYAESNGTFTNGLGDFNILQKYINEAAADSVLTLNRSYTFTVGMDENLADGIVIGKPITINGNGYTINALNKARIFKVTADNVVLNNITFTNANASGEGGAVYFDGNGNVTNCHFTDNSAENGGALYIMVDGKVENCSFTNNSAYNAGAIHFMGTGNVAKCNFIDNKATSGGAGAIDIYSGSIENCNFANNTATSDGGAVCFYLEGNVTNCTFTDNKGEYGGALYFSWDGTVTSCDFTNNQVTGDYVCGGAVYFNNNGTVIKCVFTHNKATGNESCGGAVCINFNGTVTNCSFTDNQAVSGGAVYFYKNVEGNVTDCSFNNNSADHGGAIYFDSESSGRLVNCNFTNNSANRYGGAINMRSGSVTNCTFVNNAASRGGAILMGSGSVTNCNFVNNTVTGDYSFGGAVFFDRTGELKNCNFTNNSAYSGGAVYFDGNGNVTNCNFNNNKATSFGGAINMGSGSVTNCTFVNNTANRGGAILFEFNGEASNCTFVNNAASRGGAILMGSGSVTNCNFVNNTVTGDYSFGGAAFFDRTGELTNCNFTNNSAYSGGAVYCSFYNGVGIVKNCNFNNNKATSFGGALGFVRDGELTYCNFVNNTASGDGGAIYFLNGNGEIANCNFTGNNATTGSAIYFWSTLSTKTISNSRFLNNRANADALEVTKNENNITITFTGQDNLLNAIYSRNDEVTFNNVFYWSANGINNTGNSAIKPTRSNKEPGQNITVGVVVDDVIVLEEVKVTDENGMIVLDIIAGENYYIGVRHDTDSYYTEALNIISNNTKFNVNVTSQTTNNKTVNITAKSNIPNEVIKGKLRFILPNGDEVNASYAGNGIWWTKYTFDDYGVYEVNASYSGLDNVTLNNGTVTISKFNSTISARNKTVTYPSDVVLVTAGENCTGINKSSVVIRNPDGTLADANVVVDGFSITISGLGAGNYTVYYNNTVNSNCNVAGNFTGITVLKANSSVSATDVEVTYGDLIVVVVDSKNATKVSYQIISSGAIVKEGLVNVGENITGLDLGADEYTVNLTTVVNANFTASNYKSKITVNPASSYVSAGDVEVTYGEEIVIPVSTVNAVALYYDIVDENNTVVVSDIIESGLNITVNGLSAGRYNVTYITGVDLNHTSVRNASKITVSPAGSCVSASYVAVNFGEAISIAVSSVNATEISYSIIDSNKKSVVNGSVKPGEAISVSDLAAGDYTVSLNTVTDANHTAISNSSKLHIRHVVTITIAPVTGYAGEIISITAEFKYENGDPAGEGTAGLTIKYEDKEVLGASMNSLLSADESVPVSGGKATFNVKLTNPGIYPYVVAYSGEDVDPVQGESTITVLKVNTTVSCSDISGKPTDKKDVTVTVSDHNNKSVENGTVTLTLNGKTYNATVENGKAVLSIELPNPGEYNATVTYNGNGYYNSTTSSIGVNVEKMNTKAPLAGDITGKAGEKTDITVKFVDEKGNPVKNGTATLTIDGKTYTSDVINGSATFKDVVIPEKDTVADVYYQSNDYYNASSATFSVKVKHDSNNTDKNRTEKHVSSKAADGQQTGNPIAMMLLALMVMVITYRKK